MLSYDVLYGRGYKHSSNDYCLFYKKTSTLVVFPRVYVDAIVLTWDDIVEMQALKSHLDQAFKLKDFGEAHYFLGRKILRAPDLILI